ncbi:MAG: RNA polymerase sigma factor [Chlorobi bacterium]|nr:RNA polymerase sigma factor [Chlorobiota bacterium]
MNKKISYTDFSKDDLSELLSNSLAGDSASFSKLSDVINDISLGYFKSKIKSGKIINVEDAEDLAQNVYISFAKQYQNIDNIENWLRRVLFLTFVNWYKAKRKYLHFELDETRREAESDNFSQNADLDKIVELLNDLSENKREIIKLRYWHGLKFSEIAEKLDKNEAAIKKMFYRTLEEMKKMLE